MHFKFTLQTAIASLKRNKSRSLLTILGIVIGVSAIIVISALGKSSESLIIGEISNLGAESIVIISGDGSLQSRSREQNLTIKDLETIQKANIQHLVSASPIVAVNETVSVGTEIMRPSIIGSTAELFIENFDIFPETGLPFTQDDINSRQKTALIGINIKQQLFPNQTNIIGQSIKIGTERFRVSGVFPQKGRIVFFNVDELVLIPYTTAQTYLTGENTFMQINLKADKPENVDKVVSELTPLIRQSRNIKTNEPEDFQIQTQQGLVEQVSTILSALTAFLIAVVAIALVVGGVGVMNIMLVSVTERTKEIGLRKALGATEINIRDQFLTESVILTGIGGLFGIILGTILAYLISTYLSFNFVQNWQFNFPYLSALLGLTVSTLVGLIFGIYPATKAAKLNPIEALRYE